MNPKTMVRLGFVGGSITLLIAIDDLMAGARTGSIIGFIAVVIWIAGIYVWDHRIKQDND